MPYVPLEQETVQRGSLGTLSGPPRSSPPLTLGVGLTAIALGAATMRATSVACVGLGLSEALEILAHLACAIQKFFGFFYMKDLNKIDDKAKFENAYHAIMRCAEKR